ncbi:MAG: hypothetical protein ACHP7N_11910 [Caulobacterales bacterium]
MRIAPIILALGLAAVAWSSSAQPAGGDSAGRYQSELDRQCPEKLLQDLSAADLRDGLDDYLSSLQPDARDQVTKTERTECSKGEGLACVNAADIDAVDTQNLTSDLAASLCGAFLRCRSQGDCDHAR